MTQTFLEVQLPSDNRHFYFCTHFRNSIIISCILLPGIPFSVILWGVSVKYNSYSAGDPDHFLTCVDYPHVMKSFKKHWHTTSVPPLDEWRSLQFTEDAVAYFPHGLHLHLVWSLLMPSALASISGCAAAGRVGMGFLRGRSHSGDLGAPCLDWRKARASFPAVVGLGALW